MGEQGKGMVIDMKNRKIIALTLAMIMTSFALVGCGTKEAGSGSKVFTIGVNQLVKHAALDASYQGFVDALAEAGYKDGENIKIDYQNAQGDQPTASTIATKLVNDNNDLILAIATPAAQAVANITKDIPILVTAVTDPAASGLVASNEAPGGNVSGTSDLTPVKKQIELLTQLIPDAVNVAVLYCSSESNSKIQADIAIEEGTALGLNVFEATVSDSNEIQQVVQSLMGNVDVIYVPTDNIISDGMATVASVANGNGVPVIVGEEAMVDKGGLATYGIDYYKLGLLTGKQAVKIIEGKADTSTMAIEYIPDEECTLRINEDVAEQLGIVIPDELVVE